MKPLVIQAWPQFGADEDFCRCFEQVLVEKVQLLRNSQRVIIGLRSAAPLDKQMCERLALSLKEEFAGLEIRLHNYFGFANITPDAVFDLIYELKDEGLPVNGFLDHAKIELEGTQLAITIPTGKGILDSIDFSGRLEEKLKERTDVAVKVELKLDAKLQPQDWEKRMQEKWNTLFLICGFLQTGVMESGLEV